MKKGSLDVKPRTVLKKDLMQYLDSRVQGLEVYVLHLAVLAVKVVKTGNRP